MAEETDYAIGAKASCSDGYCGELNRLIVDPAARTVTHLVIQPEHRHAPGRLVPLDLVTVVNDEIRLDCTVAEFGNLDSAQERDLVEGPLSAQSHRDVGSMGVGGSVYGAGMRMDLGHRRTVVEDVIPLGETEVGPGEPVHALDGEIGQVAGFIVSPGEHQVTHVLLKEGHLWGRKEVAIPMTAVTGVHYGIRLSITRKQVAALPPAG
jgi:hypothetical protein